MFWEWIYWQIGAVEDGKDASLFTDTCMQLFNNESKNLLVYGYYEKWEPFGIKHSFFNGE